MELLALIPANNASAGNADAQTGRTAEIGDSSATSTAAPPILILSEGGPRIGMGHIGRCLALWEELADEAAFAVEGPGSAELLAARGVPPAPASTPSPVVLIDRRTPTAPEAVAKLHAEGRRVCLLDDPGAARASADLVIDPPTGCAWPTAGGRRLAGFEHALLRAEIRAAAAQPRPGVEVLLNMGGADPEGLTPALARALRAAGVAVLTALGPAYRGPQPEGELLADASQWPAALAGARLLVGRFGHTLLEAAHLGTPALAITTGARTGAQAHAFAAHGTIEAIEVGGPEDAAAVAERARTLHADGARLDAMAARGRALVDGRGAARVAAALRELAATATRADPGAASGDGAAAARGAGDMKRELAQ
jgi:UDP-2,4-diacetamido-2,4,6-trideoxy-beta-L-altropyranose hydrolase